MRFTGASMENRNSQSKEESQSNSFYCFDTTLTQPGDIILTGSPTGKNSRIIRGWTGSDFSHAGICFDSGIFIEALGKGVRRFNLARMATRSLKNIRFLRLKDEIPDRERIAKKAGSKAEQYLTQGYWLSGALKSLLNASKKEHTSSFYCSHLVAHVYHEVGLELLPGRMAEDVYPGLLIESELFSDVTDSIVYTQTDLHGMVWSFLEDEDDPTNTHTLEVEIAQRIYGKISREFEKHELPVPSNYYDVFRALANLEQESIARAIDQKLVTLMSEEGLLTLMDPDLNEKLVHAQEIDKYVKHNLENNKFSDREVQDYLRIYRAFLSHADQELQGREDELELWRRLTVLRGLSSFALLAEHSEKMCDCFKQITTATQQAVSYLEAYESGQGTTDG